MSRLREDEVRAHWEREATRHGAELLATTKTSTAKRLEIDALARAFRARGLHEREGLEVLEAGCGNGHNLRALAELFPRARFTGVDYAPQMIEAARQTCSSGAHAERISLHVGDVLALERVSALRPRYDAIVTDRCLINLGSDEQQQRALLELGSRLARDGWLFVLENSRRTFELQNDCRERLGLPRRTPADFNHFLDEDTLFPAVASALEWVDAEDFISLHDLALYVLGPAASGGEVDYASPLVEAATRLLLAMPEPQRRGFGAFGQNRLYTLRRRADAA